MYFSVGVWLFRLFFYLFIYCWIALITLPYFISRLDIFHFPSKDVIFKPISKGKGSCKLVGPDKPYSYSTIRGAFRRHLESLGVGPSKFGLHSLRSEWASMAASNGVNDKVFRRHGRWKSLQAKDEYVDDNLEQRLEVSSFLGLWERSLVLFSCIISPNLVRLAQFFVSLYMPRIFSRQASLKKPIWFTLLCYLLCSGGKMWYFWQLTLGIRNNKYLVGTRYHKAWALGRSITGNDTVVYKGEYGTWCPSWLQNQPCTFGWCQTYLRLKTHFV